MIRQPKILEQLQPNCRGGKGRQKGTQGQGGPAHPKPTQHHRRHRRRQSQLRQPRHQPGPAQLHQFVKRRLQPDREHQQNNPDIPHLAQQVSRWTARLQIHQSGHGEQHPAKKISGEGRQLQFPQE